MSSIHGHEVLDMMKNNDYTEKSLLIAINEKFGNNTVFHTCSRNGMTAQELIQFLAGKGKFKPAKQSAFTVDNSKICDH